MKRMFRRCMAVLLTLVLTASMFTVLPVTAQAAEAGEAAADQDAVTVYFINAAGWEDVYVYTWESETAEWPGVPMGYVRDEATTGARIYSAEVDPDVQGLLFNAGGEHPEENQTVDVTSGIEDNAGWYAQSRVDGRYSLGEFTYSNDFCFDSIVTAFFDYWIDGDKAVITKYRGFATELEIPSQIEGYPVTSISDWAFSECESLTSVTIPDSVTEMGERVFSGCTSLKNVTLSKRLNSIGALCFENTIIEEIEVPRTLNYCGVSEYEYSHCSWIYRIDDVDYAVAYGPFGRCETLKTIKFQTAFTTLPENVFRGCMQVETVTLPETVTTIGGDAFADCLRLREVVMSENVTDIDNCAFSSCIALESIEIPEAARRIGCNAFQNCYSLGSVVFREGVSLIESEAFRDCTSLTEAAMPDSVTEMGERVFSGCTSLKNVTLSKRLERIGALCFENTIIEEIEVPRTLNYCGISEYEYSHCSWTYRIDDVDYAVAYGPFGRCETLKTIIFGNGETDIPDNAFRGCTQVENVAVPDTVVYIGESAFADCLRLKRVEMSQNIFEIGSSAFEQCAALESIALPENLAYLRYNCFKNCYSLGSAVFSNNTGKAEIGAYAFENCSSLTDVILPAKLDVVSESTFKNCSSLTNITIPNEVWMVADNSFEGCSSLTGIVIPDSVISLGSEAFKGCTSLIGIVIPDSVISLGSGAFMDCTSLAQVDISKRVITIEPQTFENTALVSVEVPRIVRNIRENAFGDCEDLKSISLPSSLRELSGSAFSGCLILENVEFSDYSLDSIEDETFKQHQWIKRLVLPKGLKRIGEEAFVNCTGLTDIYIPESVDEIADNAFSYLRRITVYGRAGSYAEQYCNDKNIAFVDNYVPALGLILDESVCDGEDHIEMIVGERRTIAFEMYPLDANDVITLSSDNGVVFVDKMDITAEYEGDTVVTASTTGGVEYEFTVHSKGVSGIELLNVPETLRVPQGGEIDLSGIEVQINYTDGTSMLTTDYSISDFDPNQLGTQIVTVRYKSPDGWEHDSEITVEVYDPKGALSGIAVKQLPRQLKYMKYDALDLTDLVVVETYDSGYEEEITDYRVVGYNALKTGSQTLKVIKGDYTATFVVEVSLTNPYDMGDANLDGVIDVKDVTSLQKNLAKLNDYTGGQTRCSDVNGDGDVDIIDVTAIQKHIAGLD